MTTNEYNDVVGTQYKVTTEGGTTNDATGKTINWNQWTSAITSWTTVTALGGIANTNAVAAKNFSASDTAHSGANVKFTNTLQLISPTGYVSRFAPYALILVAGIALLIVAKKRKPAKDDEE